MKAAGLIIQPASIAHDGQTPPTFATQSESCSGRAKNVVEPARP